MGYASGQVLRGGLKSWEIPSRDPPNGKTRLTLHAPYDHLACKLRRGRSGWSVTVEGCLGRGGE